jgi:uncharacterized membrane protein
VPARPVALLTAVATGLLTGGMVLIEVVLVPFWRSASPAAFRRWFTAHSGRIRALMVPLGAGAGLAGTVSAVAQVTEGRRSGPAALVAAGATAGVIAITATVNEPANYRFVSGELTGPETTELLSRWARWHHVRVVLGLGATGAAAAALAQLDEPGPRRSHRRRATVARLLR